MHSDIVKGRAQVFHVCRLLSTNGRTSRQINHSVNSVWLAQRSVSYLADSGC